jgi:hypothetical protein
LSLPWGCAICLRSTPRVTYIDWKWEVIAMQTIFEILSVAVMFLVRIGIPILVLLGIAVVIERAHKRLTV